VYASFIYVFFDVQENFLDAIIKIGLIEESAKFLTLLSVYPFIKKNFNEIVDGILYISAISLGFSVIENIFYAMDSEQPFSLLFQRSIFSTLGHLSFSGYMGIAFYIHKRIHKNYLGIVLSIVLAAFAHGFYDGFIFESSISFLFQFVFIALVILQLWMLKVALGFSAFRQKLVADMFMRTEKPIKMYCTHCNKIINTQEIYFGKIKAAHCFLCDNMLFAYKNVNYLFDYFRPIFNLKKYIKKLPFKIKISAFDINNTILYHSSKKSLSANVVELSDWFEYENSRDKTRILSIPFFGFFLKHLDLKHVIPARDFFDFSTYNNS
jgi:hypothetical protein